jgi:hypothetical protein
MRKRIIGIALAGAALIGAGCESNADKVNDNLGKAAENFEIQRKIVGINGITDKVLFEAEGKCSLEQNGSLPRNLEVICKEGPNSFKKHFVGLSDNVTWISTQVEGVDADEYRTRFILKPENIIPNFDLQTSDGQ